MVIDVVGVVGMMNKIPSLVLSQTFISGTLLTTLFRRFRSRGQHDTLHHQD